MGWQDLLHPTASDALGQEEAGELLSFLMGDDPSLKPLESPHSGTHGRHSVLSWKKSYRPWPRKVCCSESGVNTASSRPRSELHISPNVQGVLAARIDRLEPDEKALLQQLAVIGRTFPYGLVRKVVSQSEDELYRLLSSLQAKEFLYEQPALAKSNTSSSTR